MGRQIGRWLFWISGTAALAYMSWNLIFSDHGYLVYREEAQQLQLLQVEVIALKQQREQLAKDILRLRNDPDAMVELVHRELGFVYPDEFMLIMPDEAVRGKKSDVKGKERSAATTN